MSVATPKRQHSPKHSLDYHSCDVEELYGFIRSRTTLKAAAIRKLNKAKLVARLKKLDIQRTFSRFMDLHPELRLHIYERLLFIDGQESGKHHSAILRVSKVIHSEFEPVLYCKNSFFLEFFMQADRPIGLTVSGSWETQWDPFPYELGKPLDVPLAMKVDMLFGLRQLTIRLSIFRGSYYEPNNSFARICLALSSASKLKALIITNLVEEVQWKSARLYDVVSPAAFVHPAAKIPWKGAQHYTMRWKNASAGFIRARVSLPWILEPFSQEQCTH